MLSFEESIYVYGLAILTLGSITANYLHRDPVRIWSPLTMVSLVLLYYCIAGPIRGILNEETYFRAVEHRPYMVYAWRLSFIGFVTFWLGFQLKSSLNRPQPGFSSVHSLRDERFFGFRLLFISALALLILFGTGGLAGQLTLWRTQYTPELYQGAFQNYLLHGMNLSIGASCLLLIAVMKKKVGWMWWAIILLVLFLIYTKQGFRWRHVVLGLSLVLTYFTMLNRKPSPVLLLILAVVGITVMGAIGVARTYGRGLDRLAIQEGTREEFFESGFGESSIFMTTGLLVHQVPEVFPHIHFDPLIQTLAMPVPRVLWPGKPSGDYIQTIHLLYGIPAYGIGAATLSFGEYYLAFGYTGVALISFLLGFGFSRFWNWFLLNRENGFAIATYAVGVSYSYVIFSRGYLPQVVMLFFFTVFPLYLVYRMQRRRQEKYYRWLQWKKQPDESPVV